MADESRQTLDDIEDPETRAVYEWLWAKTRRWDEDRELLFQKNELAQQMLQMAHQHARQADEALRAFTRNGDGFYTAASSILPRGPHTVPVDDA